MSEKDRAYYYGINIGKSGFVKKNFEGEIVEIERIDGLSRLNIFVGANNSGKSRLLREIVKEKDVRGTFSTKKIDWKVETEALQRQVGENAVQDPQGFFRDIKGAFGNQLSKENRQEVNRLAATAGIEFPKKRYYVPLLRGLWDFHFEDGFTAGKNFGLFSSNNPEALSGGEILSKKDMFESYFRRVYADKLQGNGSEIFTGLDLYKVVKKKLLGGEQERADIAEFQEFLKTNFFSGKKVQLLPKEDDTVLSVKIGNEPDRKISELGDGIQNLIVISYLAYTNRQALIFIEEPENTIHPGLQRKLIEVLLGKDIEDRGHQYFVTTHSNHLLDLTFDYDEISVFRLSPHKSMGSRKLVQPTPPGDFSTLRELGVVNSSVFLSNFIVWVEGVSDRMYLSKFIELYQQENIPVKDWLTEDIDYSFVEYGGGNIEHWSFADEEGKEYPTIDVERITSKGVVVADDDGAGSNKRLKKYQRHKKLAKNLGDRYIKLDVREIENILSHKSLNDGIRAFPRKAEAANLFDEEVVDNKPYKDKPIGTYLDKNLFAEEGQYSFSKSGTLKEKLKFSVAATDSMQFEDMTDDAKKLAKKLYELAKRQIEDTNSSA